ncbi:MAG: T4 RnlA family RNA ligase [bacterium]
MELEVQKYLRSGKTLDNLKEELGIKSSEWRDLVILNYSQIESPKTDPIVCECRQLILQKGTWDVVFRSFERFFNYGEALNLNNDFDYSKAVALEKIDGSIIGLFYYDGQWLMTTRGVIEGDCNVNDFMLTFKELFNMTVKQYPHFWDALEEKREKGFDYCYTFELVSPENRVVTIYNNKDLYLLTARDRQNDFCELNREVVSDLSSEMGVRLPTMHNFSDISSLVQMASDLKELEEGFVCIDYTNQKNGNFSRLKVKNPAYLAISHLKESSTSSLRELLRLVILGEVDEFLAYFPEYKQYTTELQKRYDDFKDAVEADLIEASKKKKNVNRKEYALWAKDKLHCSILFLYLNGTIDTLQDWINLMITSKGTKQFGKYMIDILKIKDIEWEVE